MINNSVCGPESLLIYGVNEEDVETSTNSNGGNFLFNLSVLKEKVHQLQSLTTMFTEKCSDYSTHHHQHQQLSDQSTAEVIASNMGTLIHNIIVTTSSLMFTCQRISLSLLATPTPLTNNHSANKTSTAPLHSHHQPDRAVLQQESGEGLYSNNEKLDWYGNGYNNGNINSNEVGSGGLLAQEVEHSEGLGKFSSKYNCDIVELDAADLLAKYTHYCQVCGKGFKRDANLRMHMRAHGDEYKSPAALSNPLKKSTDDHLGENAKLPRKYSCPQEGCRWNRKHPKFQPLKSMICVKNHYKRSHCPKMYVCKRCNRKRFSIVSDLRTHEKYCGDLKWMCSCGNSFSRKDKLLGHVALFVGHTPAASSLVKMGKNYDQSPGQMQSDERFDFT